VFGRKKIAALEAELAFSKSWVEKFQSSLAETNLLVEKLRQQRDTLTQERDALRFERDATLRDLTTLQAHMGARASEVERLHALLEKAIETPRRAEPVAVEVSDGPAAMARFAAQLDAAAPEDEDEEEAAGPLRGLADRINDLYGDNPKPPPTVVWGRDLLKGPERGEE
jgi:septal ring factor EnvC (AmiA/AmiB activator)